jgi:tRNA threonylcarbamoyladenosine biosynthesis protein TsaE
LDLCSTSPEQTRAIGGALGGMLRGSEVVALSGQLGTGKTQLVKGLAVGLEVPEEEPVVSPTFVLVREYVGRLKLFHIDAYRLGGVDELLGIGLEEMRDQPGAVIAIEWADRVAEAIPPSAWRLELSHEPGSRRRIQIQAPEADCARELVRRLEGEVGGFSGLRQKNA